MRVKKGVLKRMEWVKAITELIKALSPYAWPLLVGLIVWWFRKEIRTELAALIARIKNVKGPGFENEIDREQVKLSLDNAEAGLPKEKIQEAEKSIEVAGGVTISASVTPRLVEGLSYLFELASKDPREAIKRSWIPLAKMVTQKANVFADQFEPYSPDLMTAFTRLENDTAFPDNLIRSIRSLQEVARKVFFQSQFAYDPSPKEARRFVLYSVAARRDLGEEVK